MTINAIFLSLWIIAECLDSGWLSTLRLTLVSCITMVLWKQNMSRLTLLDLMCVMSVLSMFVKHCFVYLNGPTHNLFCSHKIMMTYDDHLYHGHVWSLSRMYLYVDRCCVSISRSVTHCYCYQWQKLYGTSVQEQVKDEISASLMGKSQVVI